MRKRIFTLLAALCLLLCLLPTAAFASQTGSKTDESRSYNFDLSVGGASEVRATTGETITVTLVLKRTDAQESADMYGMQTEIEYDEREKLFCGLPPREYDPPVELHILYQLGVETMQEGDEEGAERELAAVEREAKVVAARIRELVGTPFYDAKTETERPLRYRDMTVLMRAVRGSAPLAAQMLESEGIPVFCDAGEGYFDIPEIRAMTALLQTIENGARDEPLLAALRGPALGLEES